MSPEVTKAVTMMAIALPTMFLVIACFIAATSGLRKLFPYDPSEDADDD